MMQYIILHMQIKFVSSCFFSLIYTYIHTYMYICLFDLVSSVLSLSLSLSFYIFFVFFFCYHIFFCSIRLQSGVCSPRSAVHGAQSTERSPQSTECSPRSAVHRAHSTECSVQSAVNKTHFYKRSFSNALQFKMCSYLQGSAVQNCDPTVGAHGHPPR